MRLLAALRVRRGAAAQRKSADRVFGFGSPSATRPRRAFQQGLRELGTGREKTLSLSGILRREMLIASPRFCRASTSQVDVIVTNVSVFNPCRQGSNCYDSIVMAAVAICWRRHRPSLARPEKTSLDVKRAPELSGKRLELVEGDRS